MTITWCIFQQSRSLLATPSKSFEAILSLSPSHRLLEVRPPATWEEFHILLSSTKSSQSTNEEIEGSSSPMSFKRVVVDDSESYYEIIEKFPILSTSEIKADGSTMEHWSDPHVTNALSLIYSEMVLDVMQLDIANRHIARYVVDGRNSGEVSESRYFPLENFVHKFKSANNDSIRWEILRSSNITNSNDIDQFADHSVRLMIRIFLLNYRTTVSRTNEIEHELNFGLLNRKDLFSIQPVPSIIIPSTTSSRESVLNSEFPSDSRGRIVLDFLETHKSSDLAVVVHHSNDTEQSKQKALLVNAQRMVARPIGRGAMALGLAPNMRSDVDSLPLPICLNGRFPGGSGTVSLDLSLFPIDALYWPEFHNGVSFGLENFYPNICPTREEILAIKAKVESLLSSKRPIASIPVEHLPLTLNRHAGYLLGIALSTSTGLNMLRIDDCYRYLKIQNDCISVAVILGRSIGKIGTSHPETAKLCFVHLPSDISLIPSNSSLDIEISQTIQAAALTGLGLVYAETGNRKTMELLLREISVKPIGDKPVPERECYSVSAGFALGLVGLGKGIDPRVVNKLVNLIQTDGTEESLAITALSNDNAARCSVIFEAHKINRSITLPGACIGLGLLFLKTNDSSVAGRIRIPSTSEQVEREEVRSDSFLYKYVAKSLIMWDEIEPSKKWFDQQFVNQEYLRNPNSCEHKETRQPGDEVPSSIDWLQIYQCRMYAITGLCLAIGLKFAGTCDEKGAARFLSQLLRDWLVSYKWPPTHCAAQSASRPSILMNIDRSTIETCRASLLVSLALVMAGSGDIEVLRLARVMKKQVDESTQYGISSTIDLALGILFLGGGRLTFKNNHLSTAFLLASIIPRYPASVSDNKFTLQAIRHLYVLATENRRVEIVDVDSGKITREVPAVIELKNGSIMKTILPSRKMPRSDEIASVRIESDRFYPVHVEEGIARIYVQKRPGKQSHEEDPTGNLNADKAYISGFSYPNETEVRKLLGLPLKSEEGRFRPGCVPLDWIQDEKCDTWKNGWISSCAQAAVLSLDQTEEVRKRIANKFALTNSLPTHLRNELSVSEKYSELLLRSLGDINGAEKRRHQLQILHECVCEDKLDQFFDLIN